MKSCGFLFFGVLLIDVNMSLCIAADKGNDEQSKEEKASEDHGVFSRALKGKANYDNLSDEEKLFLATTASSDVEDKGSSCIVC